MKWLPVFVPGLDRAVVAALNATDSTWSPSNERSTVTPPPDPHAFLEQRLAYRLREYVAGGRAVDDQFTFAGLRTWMLYQAWPFPASSDWLESLAVLTWSAICLIESEPEQEVTVRNELAQQLAYLEGSSARRPESLDAFRAQQTRVDLYASLRRAAEPGSRRREILGLPRFRFPDKLTP